ncbi:hypothetical protein CBR_g39947 [Chara braunii]|uniref:Uncharacterized protein n=1 Tax=Chara braunii TaxID=69332 RepID=A0A388K1W2_CHABU|nr:hypothetical protein CBR_g39947 [Chara braunii]|eukprot:GBG63943.1 hypothetical protein CBR_g39947 [Chara braunii]
MQRRFKLGDDLLTKEDLEMLRRDEFSTVGAFATAFEKMAKKVSGLAEEEQCATFLGHFKNWEASSLTKKAAPGKKLTWGAIKEGVLEGELEQVDIFQMRQARKKRKTLDTITSDGRDFKQMIEDAVAQHDAEKEAKKKTMAAPQAQGKGKKVVVLEEEEEEEEEPEPQKLTKAQRKARNTTQGGQGSGKGQAPQAIAAPPPESSSQAAPAPCGWKGKLSLMYLIDSGPGAQSGSGNLPGVIVTAPTPRSGMTFRPPSRAGRAALAARTRSKGAPDSSQPTQDNPGPSGEKETVEIPEDEEDEDEKLRKEEDKKAEERAKKRGAKASADKKQEGKKRKYKGFEIRKQPAEEAFKCQKVEERANEQKDEEIPLLDKEMLQPKEALAGTGSETGRFEWRMPTVLTHEARPLAEDAMDEAALPMTQGETVGRQEVQESVGQAMAEAEEREEREVSQKTPPPQDMPLVAGLEDALGSWATGSGAEERVSEQMAQTDDRATCPIPPEYPQQEVTSEATAAPSSVPSHAADKMEQKKFGRCFYCKRGKSPQETCPKSLKDEADGLFSWDPSGVRRDRDGNLILKTRDGIRAQLYRQLQEDMSDQE